MMPMGDAIPSRSADPPPGGVASFFQQKKRTRTDTEPEIVAPTEGSTNNINPLLRVNDVERSTESTETIITNPKLDKINDKKCCFESHEAFLKKMPNQ